ncbi:hypothetical protein GF360_00570 [candidate division WWE3 bacterium]|nr:hypothetical protein [candidate division WWE3 bacterium]
MQLNQITDFLGLTDTKSKEPEPADNPVFNVEQAGEKKTLVEWEAPLRTPLKAMGGKLKKNLLIVAIVMGLFLLLIGEYFIILVVASVVFIGYILSATPAETVHYEITTHGIKYVNQFYYWNEFGPFFITEDNGVAVLNVDMKEQIPARLFITIKEGQKEKVKEACAKYLPYLEEKPETFLDKAYEKITSKLDF